MSLYYDPQDFEEDLTHLWGTNTMTNPANLGNLDSSRIPSQHTHIKSERTQPGTCLQPTEFLQTTNAHNVGPTFRRRNSPGFDPLSSYASGECVHPSQNTFVPNNTFLSMLNGQYHQPIVPYAQQLLSYNQQYPNVHAEAAQNVYSSAYPEYPLLNDHNVYNSYNSLPYGDWVIEQAQQSFPPPIMNSYPVNAGYTMNTSHQPGHTQTENSQNSAKEREEAATPRKVKTNRDAKKKKDPLCDPRLVYGNDAETRAPWGSKSWEGGQHLFIYTRRGQWLLNRRFNNKELREYVDTCPKGTVFRVQQFPTQSNHRMGEEDCMCRWAKCPASNRKIQSGWLRVCFDEFPADTSSGNRDPLLCAGSMHLWCFEQVFDPLEFHLKGCLKPETRDFIYEETNVASLRKLTDAGIEQGAYEPWFQERKLDFDRNGQFLVQQVYEKTLSYKLNKYHLDNQSEARGRAQESRYDQKLNKGEPPKTIDVHMGNLMLFVELNQRTKKPKRASRPPEMKEKQDLPDDDSPDTSRKKTPAARAKKAGSVERMAPNLPIDAALGTLSAHSSQTQRRSPRGSDRKRTSPRRHKKELRRHVLASQPPVDRSHNLSTTTWSSTSTGSLNTFTNSTPSSSFSSLNSAFSTPQPTLQPSFKIIAPPNHNQGSLENSCPSIYPQAMPGQSFSVEDPKQPGHSLGPPSWQCQQQPFSSTATLPYVKAEDQPVFQDCSLNTPVKVSRGNGLVESCQDGTKTWTQEATEKASQVFGGSQGTSSDCSNLFKGLGPEEASIYQFLIFDEDELESTQYPESSTGAMDNIAAQTQMNAAACQPLEPVACTESPQVAAVAEPWHSVGSFMDPVNYGGYSNNTDTLSLFDDSIATA